MKKILVIAFLVVLSCSVCGWAHPPSDIVITYDSASKMLQATIVHNTSNPETHFIKKVDVALNGNEILEQAISRQDTNVSQTVSYRIPDVKAGDTLSVEGYCNLSGVLRKEIKVTDK